MRTHLLQEVGHYYTTSKSLSLSKSFDWSKLKHHQTVFFFDFAVSGPIYVFPAVDASKIRSSISMASVKNSLNRGRAFDGDGLFTHSIITHILKNSKITA